MYSMSDRVLSKIRSIDQETADRYSLSYSFWENEGYFGKTNCVVEKFLDAGIQDVSTSILIVHDLREISPEDDDDDDESDKHI